MSNIISPYRDIIPKQPGIYTSRTAVDMRRLARLEQLHDLGLGDTLTMSTLDSKLLGLGTKLLESQTSKTIITIERQTVSSGAAAKHTDERGEERALLGHLGGMHQEPLLQQRVRAVRPPGRVPPRTMPER